MDFLDASVRDTKGRISLFNHDTDRNSRLIPWVIFSLALHVVAMFVLWNLRGVPVKNNRPEVMQVMMSPPNETPPFFSELPPDRADEAPKEADFLSNVTSRARDRVPGGDSNLPSMQGQGDAPTVKLSPNRSGSSSPSGSPSQPIEQGEVRTAKSQVAAQKQQGTSLLQLPDEALRGSAGSSGDQPEMAHPDGNAAILGDLSLNTIEWDYAPWLQRFCTRLRERWFPPPAYLMGILKEGGWALIEVEISKSGKLLRLDLLDEQGHPSLSRAAQGALRSVAPIEPLPDDFPEPTLILRIRMIYPAWTP
jgi:hypothetical protein